jgi:hypothetical protein
MRRFVIVLAALASCLVAIDAEQVADRRVRLNVAGHANAFPWIASQGDDVAVVWGATSNGKADVYLALSRDGGATFSDPARVNDQPGTARLGGELPPRVALTRARDAAAPPGIVVAWGAKDAKTEIRLARSADGGKTFTPSTRVSKADADGDRGWHAVTLDARGTPHVLWLDHRALAARPKGGAHDHHAMDMSQFSGLYHAGGSDAAEREITKGVCYCCKTAFVRGDDGALYAAWRHVYPGNIRDIAFTMSRDGGRTFTSPIRVSEDNWQLAGCPDDGPAMAVGGDGTIHLVWPTVIGGDSPQGAIFYSSSKDGRTFTARQRVPTLGAPKPSHPQIIISGTDLIVAWDEVVNGVRQASARPLRVDGSGGATFGDVIPLGAGEDSSSSYPVLAATSRGVLAVVTRGTGAGTAVFVERVRK